MNLSEKYILRPAYCLRNDERRAILTTFDDRVFSAEIRKIPYNDSDTHIIHPFNAQLLAFFDGKRTIEQCINDIANYFKLDIDTVSKIIESYIENRKPLCIVSMVSKFITL